MSLSISRPLSLSLSLYLSTRLSATRHSFSYIYQFYFHLSLSFRNRDAPVTKTIRGKDIITLTYDIRRWHMISTLRMSHGNDMLYFQWHWRTTYNTCHLTIRLKAITEYGNAIEVDFSVSPRGIVFIRYVIVFSKYSL